MLRQGGTYLVVGYGGTLTVLTVELILKEITVIGNLVGNYRELRNLMSLVMREQIELRTRTYPLDQIEEAIADLRSGSIKGRAVISPHGR